MGSVGDVSRVLLACVLHALGTNPAAVRGFRNRFPKPNFEMMSARFQTSVPSFSFFLVGSVGDVSRVLLACVLHALGTNPAAVRGFRNRFPKPNFEMMSARFQTSVPSFSFFLVGSVGDVSRVLLACVLHALGTNPAAVRGFRNRFPKPNFEMMSARFQTSVPGYSRIVSCDVGRPGRYISFLFFLFSGFRRRRFDSFMACVLHALGTNPAAVRGFRNRFPKPNFEMMSARFQTSVPGYSRIVSCDVGRPGGYLFSFLFFLFSGFRRRRFESFIGLCFACLGHESCCCSRLSQPFSKAKFRDDVGAIPDERAFLFFLFSGFRRRRFESFIGLCFACLGYESCCCSRLSQPFSKAKFRDDVGAIPDERTFLFFLFSGFRRRRFESFIGLCFACLGYESCCCSRLSQPFSKAKFRDDVGAIPDERTWL